MSEFEKQIQEWVAIDNQLKAYNEKARELRQQRNSLGDNITSYIETNNLSNATINISDGRLRFANMKTPNPHTFKFIEQCLNDVITDEEKVKQIINYIKEKREYKFSNEIKRTYNN